MDTVNKNVPYPLRVLNTTDQETKERHDLNQPWFRAYQNKMRFLEQNVDPRQLDHINPEVAESWIRCRNMKIDPYQPVGRFLNYKEYSQVLMKNRSLIEAARSLYDTLKLKDLIIPSNYALYLFDTRGVLLFIEGDDADVWQLVPDYDLTKGIIWTEETYGTCAHALCMRLKRPVHLLGPEHYCVIFHNSNTSAAPIMDENGELIATLVLSRHLTNPLDESADEGFLDLSSHALGLITAMAAAVENKLKLARSYDNLKTAHSTVKTTLAVIDEGIITIDPTGKIVHTNKEGMRVLGLQKDAENRNINEFLTGSSRLLALVAKGENIDVEETICVGNDEQSYLVNIRPVVKPDNGGIDAAVLKLTSVEKMNAMATSWSGAVASFHFEDIIGESKEMKKAVALGKRFASSPENVLLIGESGTGKELFAQAIHNQYRPNGPFMAINCAAMPRELIESELFGYEGGSFTGAERNGRPGKIELAHGGTLFLDEIGDMPYELQAVLLRVLQDKQVIRIGGRRYKKVDFRVIAATNKDLYEMVQNNLFREDLYYRLSVLSINLPPLRQRGNDVELLSRYFIKNYCKKMGWKVPQISPAAMKKIIEYNWPGNVRQLENAVIYAVNTAQTDVIELEDLPAIVLSGGYKKTDPKMLGDIYTLEEMEKVVIENALSKTRNNITRSAELLGIGKSTLYRKLKEYNICIDDNE